MQFPQFYVIPGLEIIGGHHAPFSQLNILTFVFTNGDISCCKIGYIEQPGCLLITNLSVLGLDSLEVVTQFCDFSRKG